MKKRIISVLLAALMLVSLFGTSMPAGASGFEAELSAFPESYRAPLKVLHEQYPSWTFKAVNTGLKFSDAVKAESGKESLVSNSAAYSDMLKSKKIGDYDYNNEKYIIKDSGFVAANDFAVSYFLDSRNFLTAEGIFQFEKLSFDSSVTVDDVENAVRNTFMDHAKASYLDAEGNTVTVKKTYSQILYSAGKKHNVNPCFLAAKVVNEVGVHGSASTSGTNEKYPGIYNFFNVGASSDANAAQKGLGWASSGTSYGRPWTSPEKAIYGGAEFISSLYISKGQDTNYFQRFNVQPGAVSKTYSHQYMTNVSASASIAYSEYLNNKLTDKLERKHTFLIPVYEDMPGQKNSGGSISLLDCQNQLAALKTSCRLRSAPNEYSDVITTVAEGREVSVLGAFKTTSLYPESFLKYPIWAKISYTLSGKTYTGYVYYNFLKLKTQTIAKAGSHVPVAVKSNSDLRFEFISNDANVASAEPGGVRFLKAGSVLIYAFDSLGHFSAIQYSVRDDISSKTVKGISVGSITPSSAEISFESNSNYNSYVVNVIAPSGKLAASVSCASSPVKISGLNENTTYKVYVRGVRNTTYSPKTTAVKFKTALNPPAKPEGLQAGRSEDLKSVVLSWNAAKYADEYIVYKFDDTKRKYVKIGAGIDTSFTYTAEEAVFGGKFRIKAKRNADAGALYSSPTKAVSLSPLEFSAEKPEGLTVLSSETNSVKLGWNKVKNASAYRIYLFDEEANKYLRVGSTYSTGFELVGLKSASKLKFKVRAVTKLYGKTFLGRTSTIKACTLPGSVSGVKTALSDSKTVKISWKKQSGVTGYKIYVLDSASGKYKFVDKTAKTAYSLNNIKNGVTKVKLKAYVRYGGVSYNSVATPAIKISG